jgi:hypothetical protein
LYRNTLMPATLFARHARRPHEARSTPVFAMLFLLLAPALSKAAELKHETVEAWEVYVHAAKLRMEERASGQSPFLWVDEMRHVQRVRAGEVLVTPAASDNPHKVPHGLIHDWMGAVFVPNAKLDDVMRVLGDYDRYKDFYKPMVVKSGLLERTSDHEKVTLLMVKKAFSVTGAVDADNEVHLVRLDGDRVYTLSSSVRVQEIANYGQPSEHALPEGHGPGYVWRTFSVTRLAQRDDGVYVEMEMIAMSRGIPVAFRWLVTPLAEHLPQNIMQELLTDTRDAVSQETKAASLKTQIIAH